MVSAGLRLLAPRALLNRDEGKKKFKLPKMSTILNYYFPHKNW
jgi:hypothetical protein